MPREKRKANTPPKGNNEKKLDQNATPVDPVDPGDTMGTAGGFDSSSLPLASQRISTGSTSTLATAVSQISSRLLMPKKKLDDNIVNGIPGHHFGGKRDVIEVEIVNMDGKLFSTNMRSSDAIRDIFIGALRMDKNQIIRVQVAWKGKPVISFRLKEKISIDSLPYRFSYKKKTVLENGKEIINTFNCAIKGARPPREKDDGIRVVTLKNVVGNLPMIKSQNGLDTTVKF